MSALLADPGPSRGSRAVRRAWYAGLLTLVATLASWNVLKVEPGLDWGGDSSLYILHARNLVQGRPYEETGYIYNPHYPSLSPEAYPPGYPMLLAPVHAEAGLDTRKMKMLTVWLFAGALLTFALLMRHSLPPTWVLAGIAIFGSNPEVQKAGRSISSDMPFLFFVLLGLLAALRFERTKSIRDGVLVGLACLLAYTTRTVGIVLLFALISVEVIRHRRVRPVLACPVLVFAAGAFVQSYLTGGVGTYLDQLTPTIDSVVGNAAGYARDATVLWDSGDWDLARKGLFLLTGVFAGIGVLRKARTGFSTLELFGFSYLLVILIWPAYQGFRFILPLMPLFILYGLMGLRYVAGTLPPTRRRALLVLLALGMVGTVGLRHGRGALPDDGPFVHAPGPMAFFEWVDRELPEDAVLVFVKPRVLALMTGRRAVANHQPVDDQDLIEFLASIGATHMVLGPPWLMPDRRRWLENFVERNSGRLARVYGDAGFQLFEAQWRSN